MRFGGTPACPARVRRFVRLGILLFLLPGVLLHPAASNAGVPAPDAQWGGYLRAVAVRTYSEENFDDPSKGKETLDDFQGELRLKNRTFLGKAWSLEVHYELVALQGGTLADDSALRRLQPEEAADRSAGPGIIDDSRRLMQLTRAFVEEDDRIVYHRLDRLNLSYNAHWGTLRAGRQALTWGNGMIFNPMDLFNPFAPTAVLRDYKVGDDMLHLQVPVGGDEVQLLYVPRRDPGSGDVEAAASSWAAKWHVAGSALEMDFMAARHFDDGLLGAGAAGYLGGAAWRADAVYTRLREDTGRDDFLQFVVNLDYAWQWGGKNVYGLVEYFHNGLGRSGQYARALGDPALSARLERGELFTLGRNYLGGRLQYDLHPLVQPSAAVIVNLDDPSVLLQPQIAWDAATDLQFIAGGTFYSGAAGTEYGGFDIETAGRPIRLAPGDAVFLWLTRYF